MARFLFWTCNFPKRRYYLADGSVAPGDTQEVVFTRQSRAKRAASTGSSLVTQAASISTTALADRPDRAHGSVADSHWANHENSARARNEPSVSGSHGKSVASRSNPMQSISPKHRPSRNGLANFIFGFSLLLGGYLAQPWNWFGQSASARSSVASSPALATVAGRPAPQTEAIENIRVGRRVAGKNPQGAENIPEPTAENARLISLQMQKPNGCRLEMEFLWSKTDIEELNAVPGNEIPIDVPEMGIRGPATVVAISDAFSIRPGKGNLVTGRFRHEIAKDEPLFDVWLDAAATPLGCTGNHPFWSEDREDFIRADQLEPGELVLSETDGAVPIARIEPRLWEPYVYNLQVHGQHVYQVGQDGVLVHNACVPSKPFHQLMHDKFGTVLDKLGGTIRINRTANGLRGVDITLETTLRGLKDANGKLVRGFGHAELKPMGQGGIDTFKRQLFNWRNNSKPRLRGNVGLFQYDNAGNIIFQGVY